MRRQTGTTPRKRHSSSWMLAAALGTVLLAVQSISARGEDALSTIKERGYIEVAIGAGGFPYAAVAEDGSPTGAAFELAIATLKVMGITDVRSHTVDWGALIPGLLAQRYDIVTTGMFMNKQRCEAVLFSQPDTCSSQAFMVPKGNPKNLHAMADVAANSALKITMAPGSNEVRLAKESGVTEDQMVTNTDVQSRLKLLQTGRVDVWVDPTDTFTALKDQAGEFDIIQVKNAPVSCGGVAFRREDRTFRDAYDVALSQVKASGEFDKILSKYGFPTDLPKQQTRDELCGSPNE